MKNTCIKLMVLLVLFATVLGCNTDGEFELVPPVPELPGVEEPGPEPELPGGEKPGPEPELPGGEKPGPEPELPGGEKPGPEPEVPGVEKPGPEPELPGVEKPEPELPGGEKPGPEPEVPGVEKPEPEKPPVTEISGSPEMLITELRTEFRNDRDAGEYIEFRMLTAGNLGGLRVFVASNREPMIYEFKPVEVKAGEYVVLHLRTLEDSAVSEYGENLAESGGKYSSPTARDIWIPGSSKLLRRTDAVYVKDKDDRVLAAVMLSEAPVNAQHWESRGLNEIAAFLFEQGAWKSLAGNAVGKSTDAVQSGQIGVNIITRSLSRDESAANTNTAADWFATETNGLTPGLPNGPRP